MCAVSNIWYLQAINSVKIVDSYINKKGIQTLFKNLTDNNLIHSEGHSVKWLCPLKDSDYNRGFDLLFGRLKCKQ